MKKLAAPKFEKLFVIKKLLLVASPIALIVGLLILTFSAISSDFGPVSFANKIWVFMQFLAGVAVLTFLLVLLTDDWAYSPTSLFDRYCDWVGSMSRKRCMAHGHYGPECKCYRCGDIVHTWDDWKPRSECPCELERACIQCPKTESSDEHLWSDWKRLKEASCEHGRQCSKCGRSETTRIHKWLINKCEICGDVLIIEDTTDYSDQSSSGLSSHVTGRQTGRW